MKAVIYARFSSDNQREESITAQVRACTEYAMRKGYAVLKVYPDEAKSAVTDNRPNFLQLINDAKSKLFDVVLVHKLDRFARNRFDSAFYKRELRRCGTRVESVLEQLDDSPESVILESVLEGLAEYYSKNLAREVMKGMHETALQAKHCGGTPPLGFDVDSNKNYVINEQEAKAVRLIFELYDAGFGYDRIISELNTSGFLTKRGKPFGKNSLHEILKNEKYTGVYTFNKRQGRTADGMKNNRRQKSHEEIIRVPGALPAIIESSLFERVQEKMFKNRQSSERARNKAKTTFLLSGLIKCGHCGSAYIGNTATAKGQRYGFYECGARDRTRSCNNRRVRKHILEGVVLEEMEQNIFSPEARDVLADKVLNFYQSSNERYNAQKNYLERELNRVDTAIKNLMRILESGNISSAVLDQLKTREEEKLMLQGQLMELSKQVEMEYTKEDVLNYLEALYQQFKEKENDEQLKPIVQQFVNLVTIFDEEVEVDMKIVLVTSGGGGGS